MAGTKLMFNSLYVLALTLTGAAPSKDVLSDQEVRDIEKFAGDVMGCANIPGLALSVIRGDDTFSTGLGVANMATGHPVDKRTIFNLGSTSKAFVPYVLAEIMNGKENHDGRIQWETTLKEILRHDSDIHLPLTWADTTLKDMLIFKSGNSAADMSTMVGLPVSVTREEMIRRLRFLPRSSEFRKSNHYSNYMHTIAGHLGERMSGMTWADLVKAKVFDKFGMDVSTFAPDGMAVEDSALPYKFHALKPGEQFLEQNATLFNLHPSEPAGSLMSSAEDMSKWLRHLVKNLNVKGNDSGINMLIEDAFHLWVTVPADHGEGALVHQSEAGLGYGMGWYASTYRGQRRYKFSGGMYAYHTQIWLFPDSLSAIFVSINGPGVESAQRALEGILYHIADTVLRKSAWVSTEMACCCLESDYHNDSKSHETSLEHYMVPAERYVGVFGNGLVGNLVIELNNGALILKIGRNFVGTLSPGVTEFKLKFTSKGPLLNTEEWVSDKMLEFLPLTSENGNNDIMVFDKVRIYVKDRFFYEFKRGLLFETILGLAEEIERKQQDDTRNSIQNNRGRKQPKGGVESSDAYSNHVNDETARQGSHDRNPKSGDIDFQSSSGQNNNIKTSSDIHQNQNPDTGGHQNSQPGYDTVKGGNVSQEKVHYTNDSDSKLANTSSSIQTLSVWAVLVLVVIFNIVFTC